MTRQLGVLAPLALAIGVSGCSVAAPMFVPRAATAACEREYSAWDQFVGLCLVTCEHCPGGFAEGDGCPFSSDDVMECYALCPLRCEEFCESEREVTCWLDCESACGIETVTVE